MPWKIPPLNRLRYHQHKRNARKRGIPFLFTFEEWWSVWLKSGHWEERGNAGHQYCMARYGDAGPYAVDNVAIVTQLTNRAEMKPPFAGHTHRDVSKQRIGQSLTGRPVSVETRQLMSRSMQGNKNGLGRRLSCAQKKAISERMKGNTNRRGTSCS